MFDRVTELKNSIEKAFHEPLNASQLWALTKLAKHVRLRARNNNAFNNLMNNLFPHASFRTVTKTKKDGTTYPGLKITTNGVDSEEDDSE